MNLYHLLPGARRRARCRRAGEVLLELAKAPVREVPAIAPPVVVATLTASAAAVIVVSTATAASESATAAAAGAKPASLGASGGGLAWSGTHRFAVALDTHASGSDPSGNFVGLATGASRTDKRRQSHRPAHGFARRHQRR